MLHEQAYDGIRNANQEEKQANEYNKYQYILFIDFSTINEQHLLLI